MNLMIIILNLVFLFAPAHDRAIVTDSDFSGTWEYSVNTPEGTYKGAIVLEKTDDGYTGQLSHSGSNLPAKDLVIEGNSLKFNVMVDGFYVVITGDFEGDQLNAVATVEGTEMPFVAKRK